MGYIASFILNELLTAMITSQPTQQRARQSYKVSQAARAPVLCTCYILHAMCRPKASGLHVAIVDFGSPVQEQVPVVQAHTSSRVIIQYAQAVIGIWSGVLLSCYDPPPSDLV